MADFEKPTLPDPVAQEAKLVGDDELEVRDVPVEQVVEEQPAQVPGKPDEPADTVNVHETSVALDEVITDTSDPRAVQIPDAGRGSLDLPAHALANPTPEQVFADSASESEEVPDEDREAARVEGRSSGQAEEE